MKFKDQKPNSLKKTHRRYLDEFLGNYEKLNKSQHTIKNYGADLLKFFKWYEFVRGGDISHTNSTDIDSYKDFLSGIPAEAHSNVVTNWWRKLVRKEPKKIFQPPLSVGSKRRHISSIKNFFEYMIQAHDGKLKGFKQNPVKSKIHTIKLKDADVSHTKLLTEAAFDSLMKCSKNATERLMLTLLYYGGLRLEELTNVQVSGFSQRHQTLRILRKGGSYHTLKLQNFEEIFKYLVKHLGHRLRESDQLFLNRFGMPISSRGMYARAARLFKRAGLSSAGFGPHSFRKACATNLYIKTKDILMVRNYLNHKDAKVTQTYIEYYD